MRNVEDAGVAYLTPIRLFVWLRAPQLRLRYLAAAADRMAPLPGGLALGALRSMASHGDPAVHIVSAAARRGCRSSVASTARRASNH